MDTRLRETTMIAAQEAPIRVSAPFVRAFALSPSVDLADELPCSAPTDDPSAAQRLIPVAVKLLVPSAWEASAAAVVATIPELALYTHPHGTDQSALLVIGLMPRLQACAAAFSTAEPGLSALALELLEQLRHLSPREYQSFRCGDSVLDFSAKTGIMGILNITPDSFYDGGRYLEPQRAVDHAHQMVAEGADIIDIGGQSSRPGSDPVSEAEEARRVLPVVRAVAKSVPTLISVDTYRASIARAVLDAGAHLINDISALRFDPGLLGVVAEYRAGLILMHMQGMPKTMQLNPAYEALIDEVFSFLQGRLATAKAGGVEPERLLIDPGIGFGKGTRHNLEIVRKLHHFHALGQPIVIGTSRKAFIGRILGVEVNERLEGTAASVAAAIGQGADIVRVHDVLAMARVARLMDALVRPRYDHQDREQKASDRQP